MKKKAFTLIELIAVLVILAILALIVTPLVMNIIRKARISADKRSIDAYGRSIELAIASYLLDTGSFPTSIDELTIEYSGDRVVCETSQLNSDSSVYLAGCTVAGRSVDYEYGSDKSPSYTSYTVGDEITYNNVNYYVIKNSGTKESTVTLLKKEPLTVEEVNLYGGVGTDNNHVNMYVTTNTNADYYQTAYNVNSSGYGGMAYYSSATCGNGTYDGCTADYAQSEVKYVVDAWAAAKTTVSDLRTDSTGYKARLLTIDDLIDNLGYSWQQTSSGHPTINENVPSFMIPENHSYWYWTMSQHLEDALGVWNVDSGGSLASGIVHNHLRHGAVRPVIILSKSAL